MVKTQQKVIVRPVQQNNCLKMRQKKKEPKVRKAAAIFTYSSVSHSNKKQTLSGHDNICLKRHKNKKCLKRLKNKKMFKKTKTALLFTTPCCWSTCSNRNTSTKRCLHKIRMFLFVLTFVGHFTISIKGENLNFNIPCLKPV